MDVMILIEGFQVPYLVCSLLQEILCFFRHHKLSIHCTFVKPMGIVFLGEEIGTKHQLNNICHLLAALICLSSTLLCFSSEFRLAT